MRLKGRDTKAGWRRLAPSLPSSGRIPAFCWLAPGYGSGCGACPPRHS
jgi:hypothetical protein